MNKLFSFCLVIFFFSSCASRQQLVYLQEGGTIPKNIYEEFTPRIQHEDLITITVSAGDLNASMPFNQQNAYQLQAANANDLAFKPTYLVNKDGEIDFPVLGKIKVEGLTRLEAADFIRDKLKKYILDPGVNLTFANFKITVLGEVNNPGSYTLLQERVNILEALGLAGDMTIRGMRNNVLILRERNGERKIERLDLTKDEVLNSPYYYLAQNDIIYVEPNGAQIRSSSLGQNTNVLISISSLFITVVALILR